MYGEEAGGGSWEQRGEEEGNDWEQRGEERTGGGEHGGNEDGTDGGEYSGDEEDEGGHRGKSRPGRWLPEWEREAIDIVRDTLARVDALSARIGKDRHQILKKGGLTLHRARNENSFNTYKRWLALSGALEDGELSFMWCICRILMYTFRAWEFQYTCS